MSRRQRKAVGEPGLRGVRRRRQRLEDDEGVEVGDVMARARAAGDCCDHGGSIVFEESLFEGELYAWRNVCAECGEVMASGGR